MSLSCRDCPGWCPLKHVCPDLGHGDSRAKQSIVGSLLSALGSLWSIASSSRPSWVYGCAGEEPWAHWGQADRQRDRWLSKDGPQLTTDTSSHTCALRPNQANKKQNTQKSHHHQKLTRAKRLFLPEWPTPASLPPAHKFTTFSKYLVVNVYLDGPMLSTSGPASANHSPMSFGCWSCPCLFRLNDFGTSVVGEVTRLGERGQTKASG